MNSKDFENSDVPVLPLRDIVVYPHMVIPLFIGREKSIKCVQTSMEKNKKNYANLTKRSINR